MAITANRSGNNAVVTITVDIADILALPTPIPAVPEVIGPPFVPGSPPVPGTTAAQKRRLALERAFAEMELQRHYLDTDNAKLDEQVARLTAEATRRVKAGRIGGSL